MKRPIFAANWKMNHGPTDAKAFMRTFLAHYARRPDRTVLFFPPTATLQAVMHALHERSDILVGVQNIHWEDQGAFTGEISAVIARDAGARLVLVGHSERRHVFGETDEQTGRKCAAAVRSGLTPILCVGEKLEEREAGKTDEVVVRQLRAGVGTLEPNQIATMLVAYEPVWAIGSGRAASPADATAAHRVLRSALRSAGGERGTAVPILYGGSVNRGNASSYIEAPDIDGLLVGGASLDAEGWSSIVRS